MASTCKRSLLVEVGNLRCLNKYLYRERKYNDILERNALNIYIYICVVENEDYESLL